MASTMGASARKEDAMKASVPTVHCVALCPTVSGTQSSRPLCSVSLPFRGTHSRDTLAFFFFALPSGTHSTNDEGAQVAGCRGSLR